MGNQIRRAVTVLAGALLFTAGLQASTTTAKPPAPLAERIRKELVMLPWYGVFDNLSFQLDGNKVTLLGQVSRPTLRSDAENVVKHISGVAEVANQIEVLPLSGFDNGIRLRVYRAVFGFSSLYRYGLGAQPSIRIIVKNGNVTLEGVVANATDRNLAELRANGVFGVFAVVNHLQVESRRS